MLMTAIVYASQKLFYREKENEYLDTVIFKTYSNLLKLFTNNFNL